MSIREFLLARIASEERRADGMLECLDRTRRLKECLAKRVIVDQWGPHEALDGPNLLSVLATVYSDHPDYDPAWALSE